MKALSEIILPNDRKYTDEHVWAKKEGDVIVAGISDFAQDQLGEVVFIELPPAGARYAAAAGFGTVESIKSVNTLFMPVSGEVTAVNSALEDAPAMVNDGCYDKAWMIKIKPDSAADIDALLSADAYRAFLNK